MRMFKTEVEKVLFIESEKLLNENKELRELLERSRNVLIGFKEEVDENYKNLNQELLDRVYDVACWKSLKSTLDTFSGYTKSLYKNTYDLVETIESTVEETLKGKM